MVSSDDAADLLRDFGFTPNQAKIYLAIIRLGITTVGKISTLSKIRREDIYRILPKLEKMGLIERVLGSPIKIRAIPVEDALSILIKQEEEKANQRKAELLAKKKVFLEHLNSLRETNLEGEYPIASFQNLSDIKRIYKEILNMTEQSEKEVLELTTSSGLIRKDVSGIYDAFIDLARKNRNVEIKVLADISRENYSIVEKITKLISKGNLNIEWRHAEASAGLFPQFLIKDEEEAILYVTSRDEASLGLSKATGLKINSEIFVSTLREIFVEMWRGAIDAKQRIQELKTGIPIAYTAIIRDAQEGKIKLNEVLDATKKEIVIITSSMGIATIMEDNLFKGYLDKGLRFKIMAPIDLDNFTAAEKLSKLSELRHISISYLMMVLVDNEHLFMFEAPILEKEIGEKAFSLDNLFYTNDARYVEKVAIMLSDIWKRGIDFEGNALGPSDKILKIRISSSDRVSTIVDKMLNNKVHSVIVTENNNPVGIVNEKDILDKIIRDKKNPEETRAREIMSIPILAIELNEPLVKALNTMRASGLKRAAIVRDGKLVGMLK